MPATIEARAAELRTDLPPTPRSVLRSPDGTVRTDLDEAAVREAVARGEGTLWVDVDARSAEQHAWLRRVFRFHPLAIEDTENPSSRVKLDDYGDVLFVIVRGVRFDETTDDPYDLTTANLCVFLGPHYVVSVRRSDTGATGEVAARVAASPDLLARGPARLLHALVDASVDRYFPLLDRLDEFVDALEERVFVAQDPAIMREAFQVKRVILSLRRHLGPQRDVLNGLATRPHPLLPAESQLYFRDVYDHVLRILDGLDTYRELMSSTIDASLSQTSNRLSTVTKTLSVLATLTLPFVMVSGMWGMNFARIPLSEHPHGFAILLAVQLGIGVALVGLLRLLRIL